MPRSYHAHGVVTVGANKTAITLIGTAAIRPKVYEMIIGCPATPAAQAALWAFQLLTAGGTGTAFTPMAVDPGDPAALSAIATNHSVEPTYTANAFLWELPLNQQATFDWKANAGKELTLAASATAGGGLRTLSSTGTAVHDCSMFWDE